MNPSSTEAPIGLVVGSSFSYAAALEFPSPLLAALAVTKYVCTLLESAKNLTVRIGQARKDFGAICSRPLSRRNK